MLNNLLHRPDHIIRTSLLSQLPVHLSGIFQFLRIDTTRHQNRGSNRRELVERLCVTELASRNRGWDLEIASRNIVPDCVAEHVVECIRFRDVLAVFADYGAELALVIELRLRFWVDGHVFVGAGECVGWLREDYRVGGDSELGKDQQINLYD